MFARKKDHGILSQYTDEAEEGAVKMLIACALESAPARPRQFRS